MYVNFMCMYKVPVREFAQVRTASWAVSVGGYVSSSPDEVTECDTCLTSGVDPEPADFIRHVSLLG